MRPKQQTPIHILLADDDLDDHFFFKNALKEIPLATQLTTVNDGELLFAYLSHHSERLPDVLFLDLNMPRKNGSECLIEIKRDAKLNRIPVIIYSTCLQSEMADELYQKGAHYYLKKYDIDELPKYIQRVLVLLAENPNRPSRDKFIDIL